MSQIQRFEHWPQEYPLEDDNGTFVLYEDHRKVVEEVEAKLTKAIELGSEMADRIEYGLFGWQNAVKNWDAFTKELTGEQE